MVHVIWFPVISCLSLFHRFPYREKLNWMINFPQNMHENEEMFVKGSASLRPLFDTAKKKNVIYVYNFLWFLENRYHVWR